MADITSVPPIVFSPTGLILPAESAILAGVQADMNAALGGNVNPALNTPQGQLASSLTAIIADSNDLFAEYVNQVNPDTATDFMQDAIARIYFLNRNAGTPTAVQCLCTGLFNTPINVGAQAQDTSGNLYVCTQAGVIPIGGSITLSFANVALGPNPCPANTLTTIYQSIPGWESITNPAAGVPGTDVETQAQFAYRRTQSVALNAINSLSAIYAAVFDVAGVIDVYCFENTTNATLNVGSTNYPMSPHSIYVGVTGGAAQDIGNAIWTKKSLGCDMNGNTTVTVTDTSGYLSPVPTYTIKYNVPAALPIYFAINVTGASLPTNIVTLIQQAVIAAFTGADGSNPVRIGSLLLASKFYAPIVAIGSEISILSIFVGLTATGPTPALYSLQIGIDQKPTISASQIAVTVT